MNRIFLMLLIVLLAIPGMSQAADDKKGSSFVQDLKQAGKEVKKSARDVGKEIKKDVKQAGKDLKKTGKEAKKDLKEAGKDIKKESKKSGKGFTHSLKKSVRRAGKALSETWHGIMDFMGFGKKDKDKKKDNPTEKVGLDAFRTV